MLTETDPHHARHHDHVGVHGLGAPLLGTRAPGGLPLLSQGADGLVRLYLLAIKPAKGHGSRMKREAKGERRKTLP